MLAILAALFLGNYPRRDEPVLADLIHIKWVHYILFEFGFLDGTIK